MISSKSAYELQRSFKTYLISSGCDAFKANLISNDALFMYNQKLDISFDFFLEKGVTSEVKECLVNYFMLSGSKDYAEKEAEQYSSAMQMLYDYFSSRYDKALDLHEDNVENGWLVRYCSTMRIQYSYKPLLLRAMLDIATTNGSTTLSEITHYFISFYSDRLNKGLVSEKNGSVFSRREISFLEAKQNILNNAIRILEKDGVVVVEYEKISFSQLALYDYLNNKTKVAQLCEELIEVYYKKIDASLLDYKEDKERMLGHILHKMYSEASRKEKVIMIHLFGVKYGELIENDHLNVRLIVKHANMPNSYYVEVRKGIRLAKYVTAKD